MFKVDKTKVAAILLTLGGLGCARSPVAVRIEGQGQVGGGRLRIRPSPFGGQGPANQAS
jgi:hypothetical protein